MSLKGYPLSGEAQYAFALRVKCPWAKCRAEIGQKCNAVVFPQYPHTDRLRNAFIQENFEPGIQAMKELDGEGNPNLPIKE